MLSPISKTKNLLENIQNILDDLTGIPFNITKGNQLDGCRDEILKFEDAMTKEYKKNLEELSDRNLIRTRSYQAGIGASAVSVTIVYACDFDNLVAYRKKIATKKSAELKPQAPVTPVALLSAPIDVPYKLYRCLVLKDKAQFDTLIEKLTDPTIQAAELQALAKKITGVPSPKIKTTLIARAKEYLENNAVLSLFDSAENCIKRKDDEDLDTNKRARKH